jgi:hypothetical protein
MAGPCYAITGSAIQPFGKGRSYQGMSVPAAMSVFLALTHLLDLVAVFSNTNVWER